MSAASNSVQSRTSIFAQEADVMKRSLIMRSALIVITGLAMLVFIGCGNDKKTPTGGGNTSTNPTGRLYVLNQADNSIFKYDTKTLQVLDTVPSVIKLPHYIEFSPDGQFYYIVTLEHPTGHIAKYDAMADTLIDSVQVPTSVLPSAIAITADGAFGYVCNFTFSRQSPVPARIYKYKLDNFDTVSTIQAGLTTHDLKITSDGSVVIACNRNSDMLNMIYPKMTPDSVARISMDPDSGWVDGKNTYGPFGVAISHNDSLAFIACMDAGQVRVLDIAAQKIIDSIDIPGSDPAGTLKGPTLLAVSPDDDIVWVTTQFGNSVVGFRVSTMTVVANIPFEIGKSFGVTISDDGSRVYVACVGETKKHGRIYVIDGNTFTKVDSLDVGELSFGLIYRPAP